MCSHQGEADEGILRSYRWCYDGVDEDTLLEEHCCHTEGLLVVSDEERYDRRSGITDLEAQLAEAIQAVRRLLLQGEDTQAHGA